MAVAYDISGRAPAMNNRFEVRGETTAVFLKRRYGNDLQCFIDTEDLPLVQLFHWTALDVRKSGRHLYARSAIRKGSQWQIVMMHRLVMQAQNPQQTIIDHINHNGLDNRKANLRAVSSTMNSLNRVKPGCGAKSSGNKWHAEISYRGKYVFLGSYDTKHEASLVHVGAYRLLEALET